MQHPVTLALEHPVALTQIGQQRLPGGNQTVRTTAEVAGDAADGRDLTVERRAKLGHRVGHLRLHLCKHRTGGRATVLDDCLDARTPLPLHVCQRARHTLVGKVDGLLDVIAHVVDGVGEVAPQLVELVVDVVASRDGRALDRLEGPAEIFQQPVPSRGESVKDAAVHRRELVVDRTGRLVDRRHDLGEHRLEVAPVGLPRGRVLKLLAQRAETRQAQRSQVGGEIASVLADRARSDLDMKVSLEMIEATRDYEQRAALIRTFVRQDPARAALVVRDLIRTDAKEGGNG